MHTKPRPHPPGLPAFGWFLIPALAPFGCVPSPSATADAGAPPRSVPGAHSQSWPLIVDPDPVDLGTMRSGQAAEATMTVRNPGSETVVVERVETSCPCIRVVGGEGISLRPGEALPLGVAFDPNESPDLRRGLSVVVEGFGKTGAVLYRAHVEFDVER